MTHKRIINSNLMNCNQYLLTETYCFRKCLCFVCYVYIMNNVFINMVHSQKTLTMEYSQPESYLFLLLQTCVTAYTLNRTWGSELDRSPVLQWDSDSTLCRLCKHGNKMGAEDRASVVSHLCLRKLSLCSFQNAFFP